MPLSKNRAGSKKTDQEEKWWLKSLYRPSRILSRMSDERLSDKELPFTYTTACHEKTFRGCLCATDNCYISNRNEVKKLSTFLKSALGLIH